MKPVTADMMKRVRGTAKWSQLYKSGPSIPPKNKASFLNNDDDEDQEGENAEGRGAVDRKNEDALMSNGTYRHMQNEFDDMQGIGMSDDGGRLQMDGSRGNQMHAKNALTPDMQVGLTTT
jgi:hypothetical protein